MNFILQGSHCYTTWKFEDFPGGSGTLSLTNKLQFKFIHVINIMTDFHQILHGHLESTNGRLAAEKLNKSLVISIQQTNNLPLAGYIIATDVAKATNSRLMAFQLTAQTAARPYIISFFPHRCLNFPHKTPCCALYDIWITRFESVAFYFSLSTVVHHAKTLHNNLQKHGCHIHAVTKSNM